MKATAATGRSHVQTIVKGIIEGETRSIVSGMTMEEIFKERQIFKTKIIENVQSELEQFGLKMYGSPSMCKRNGMLTSIATMPMSRSCKM